ncbi:unnamed protein product [Callosobruchus maculatus]|uniref:Uncharacterized protein n=1 Tax=Callosobruchus maculatus TaxID=64391 RepID=A0A653CI73_CALMS|nr:unnamed protein product [Callosobruchus maculatus]
MVTGYSLREWMKKVFHFLVGLQELQIQPQQNQSQYLSNPIWLCHLYQSLQQFQLDLRTPSQILLPSEMDKILLFIIWHYAHCIYTKSTLFCFSLNFY